MENFDILDSQIVYNDTISDVTKTSFSKNIDDINNVRISTLGKLLYLKPGELIETMDEPLNLVSVYLNDGSLFNKFSIEGSIIEYFWFTCHIELIVFFLLDSTLLIYTPSGHKIKSINIESLFLENYPRLNPPNFEDIRSVNDRIFLLYDTNSFLQLSDLVSKDDLKQLYSKSQYNGKLTSIIPDINAVKPNTTILSFDIIRFNNTFLVYSLNKTSSLLSVIKYDFRDNSTTSYNLAYNYTNNTNFIKLITIKDKLYTLLYNNAGNIVLFDDNLNKELITIKIDTKQKVKKISILYCKKNNILILADNKLLLLNLQLESHQFKYKELSFFDSFKSPQIFASNTTKFYIYSESIIYSLTLFDQLFQNLTEKLYNDLTHMDLNSIKENFEKKYSENKIKNFFLFLKVNNEKKFNIKTLLFIYNFGFNLLSLKNNTKERINILYNLKFLSNYIKTKHEGSLKQLYKLTNNKNNNLLFSKDYIKISRTVIEFDRLKYSFNFNDLFNKNNTLKEIINESLYYNNLKTYFSLILLYYKTNSKIFNEHFAEFLQYKLKHSFFKKNEFLVMFLIQIFGYKWEPSVIILIINVLKDSYNLLSKREFMINVLNSDYVKLTNENKDNDKLIEMCKMFVSEGMVKEIIKLVVKTNKFVIYEIFESINIKILEEFKGTYYEEYTVKCYLNEKCNKKETQIEDEKLNNMIQNRLNMLKNK